MAHKARELSRSRYCPLCDREKHPSVTSHLRNPQRQKKLGLVNSQPGASQPFRNPSFMICCCTTGREPDIHHDAYIQASNRLTYITYQASHKAEKNDALRSPPTASQILSSTTVFFAVACAVRPAVRSSSAQWLIAGLFHFACSLRFALLYFTSSRVPVQSKPNQPTA